jgi:pimeloyl-ACP methyl ester carboxylesterase
MKRLRGLKALVHDAVDATTGLVREGQDSTGRSVVRAAGLVPGLGDAAGLAELLRRLGTGATLASVRGVNRLVEALTDAVLDELPLPEVPSAPVPLRSDAIGSPAWVADAALGLLGGAVGDRLGPRHAGLDLGFRLRIGDRYVDEAPDAVHELGRRVVVLVHGLGTTEWSWCLEAAARLGAPDAHLGTRLAALQGWSPVLARYNTGRRVATSAAALSDALDALVARADVAEIALVGHSMGGLVARAAAWRAEQEGRPWVARARAVATLGSPHQGAPLARFGDQAAGWLAAVDLPVAQVLARLVEARSAGIHDLRTGAVEGVADGAPPLVPRLRYAFLSSTITRDPEHPVGQALGDLLVRVPSASGPAGAAAGHAVRVVGGVTHAQLQVHPAVLEALAAFLAEAAPTVRPE